MSETKLPSLASSNNNQTRPWSKKVYPWKMMLLVGPHTTYVRSTSLLNHAMFKPTCEMACGGKPSPTSIKNELTRV